VLTCTLCVPRAADGLLDWMLGRPGNEDVRSVNVVVGETNDGYLLNTAIRHRPVMPGHVVQALEAATDGPVAEGAVGAGRGTVAFGWKGGIGTASRRLGERQGGYTVGVLIQSNFGGLLTIGGVRLWEPTSVGRGARDAGAQGEDGSIMIVIATDAPLDSRQLERLAARAFIGVGRTGSHLSNGSGDFAIAFSTSPAVRRGPLEPGRRARAAELLANDAMSPLFQAVAEATEEAIVNSLFRAVTVRGARGTARALPLDSVIPILRSRGVLR
jgi:D-aminopeptidase